MICNCKYRLRGLLTGFFLLAFMAGGWGSAMAAAESPSSGNPSAAPQKIHITADRLISDSGNNQAEFVGNVRATQGKTRITADRLKIFFTGGSTASNAPSAQSIEKLVASGNVEIKFDNRLAVAKQAVYITAERVLVLTGPDASVTSGENTISGEKITFYREDGRFTVEGGSGGRVNAVILPAETSGLE